MRETLKIKRFNPELDERQHWEEFEVDVEPTRRRRRQVGVDLHRLIELEGQVIGEPRQTRILAEPEEGDLRAEPPCGVQLAYRVGDGERVRRVGEVHLATRLKI